ncbi:MAG: hypothetical protein K0U84_01710 [Actinomycetia bacterium]|nr:hypothetical protein [Actinomycetes bacterium]
MSLATRLAPHLAGLVHPGDDDTPPFPITLPVFQTATLPDGMAQEMAAEAGIPTPDIALHFLEAVLHLIETVGEVELIDRAEVADLRAAAAANEAKRHQTLTFTTRCGTTLRAMVRDFNTTEPKVPCDMVIHDCKGKQ